MKKASLVLATLGSLAVALPALVTPADAYTVRKSVHIHHGPYGERCRVVRKVKHGFHGRRVVVRRHCR